MEAVFEISEEEKEKCLQFAVVATAGKYQSEKDFGSAEIRKKADQIADITEGKIAEIGFQKFLRKNFNFNHNPDFRHYPSQMEIDFGSDIDEVTMDDKKKLCPFRLDVKSTRQYSQWLLVEKHKFWASAYVCVKINLPRDFEKKPESCLNTPTKAETAGFLYSTDLIDPETKKPWFIFKQDESLPKPRYLIKLPNSPNEVHTFCSNMPTEQKFDVQLKAPVNYGMPIGWLRKEKEEWEHLITILRTSLISKENQIFLKKSCLE